MSRDEQPIWKQIDDLQYEVNQFGDVRHIKTQKIRKIGIAPQGYKRFDYWRKDGSRKNMSCHRAVANAFVPLVEGKHYVNHIDSNRANNYYKNLEWCTTSENVKHGYKSGLAIPINGEHNGRHKLTQNQIINIRHAKGAVSQTLLAKLYNIDQSHVSYILNRKYWRHI